MGYLARGLRILVMDYFANRLAGQELMKLRKKAGLSQEEVAKRLATPQSFVSKVETGERALHLVEIYAYAHALGVETLELVDNVGLAVKIDEQGNERDWMIIYRSKGKDKKQGATDK